VSGSPLEGEDAEKAGLGIKKDIRSFRSRCMRRREREQDHRIAVSHDDFARPPRITTRHMSGQISWDYDRAEIITDGVVHAIGVCLGLIGAVIVIAVNIERIEIVRFWST
jgi:hypothetical protein